MRFAEIEGLLSADEIMAIQVLESYGWEILTETKIEDTFRKDGGRIRTFALSGRYACSLVLKDAPIEKRQSRSIVPDPKPAAALAEEVSPNFWLDESNWKRLQKEPFAQAIESHVNELIDVIDEVRDEVHRKFDRMFDPDDWPL
jgi:hypothetical protein